jgi:hypothetical protein
MGKEIVHKKVIEGTLVQLRSGSIGIVTKSKIEFCRERAYEVHDPWVYEVLVSGEKLELVRESFEILKE